MRIQELFEYAFTDIVFAMQFPISMRAQERRMAASALSLAHGDYGHTPVRVSLCSATYWWESSFLDVTSAGARAISSALCRPIWRRVWPTGHWGRRSPKLGHPLRPSQRLSRPLSSVEPPPKDEDKDDASRPLSGRPLAVSNWVPEPLPLPYMERNLLRLQITASKSALVF